MSTIYAGAGDDVVTVFVRFDRLVDAEHLDGIETTRQTTVRWKRAEAEAVIKKIADGVAGGRAALRCEIHGDLLAYIEELHIVEDAR